MCQDNATASGGPVSPSALQSGAGAEAKQIMRLEREIKSLRLQLAELDASDEAAYLARLRTDADVASMDRVQLLQKIANLEAKYRFSDLDACVVGLVRKAAKETFAGNCGFVDDDLHLLTAVARWALRNGIPDDLNPEIIPKAKAALASAPGPIEEPRSGDTGSPLGYGQPDTNDIPPGYGRREGK